MKVELLCKYCNHKFSEYFYYVPQPDDIRCPQCKSKNPDVLEKRDAFGYDYKAKEKDNKKLNYY